MLRPVPRGGYAAAGWPLAARAQQAKLPVIGFLHSAAPAPYAHLLAEFHRGLKETGHIEGQNLAIEFRWAEGRYDRLPALAADLVERRVAVIASAGGMNSVFAARNATATIPIVFNAGGDLIKLGVVASLARPGGNMTGVNNFASELEAKRLGLLRELVPNAALIAVLMNPNNQNFENQLKDLQGGARAAGQKIHIFNVSNESEVEAAFAALPTLRPQALLVCADPFLYFRRDQVVALTARDAIPAVYDQREFVLAGGLSSYGTSLADGYRQVGIYAGRILKGEKPADLPVVQPTKFEFVINLKTAKALGLNVPPQLLARADEVIE